MSLEHSGFTLIELLVVVAIMGILMTMAFPAMYRQMHPDSMRKATEDLLEACAHARAQAILCNVPVELQIRPRDRTLQVTAAATRSLGPSLFGADGSAGFSRMDASGSGRSGTSPLYSPTGAGEDLRMEDLRSISRGPSVAGLSLKLSEQINIQMLDVNFFEFKDEEMAQVRFYPNGTSDEFTIVMNNNHNEYRKITLEVVTALATVETDPNKFLR